ncbi:3-hydroxyacyl-ACP dehydratase FabZ [Sneathiella sp. CAU 1612]|jgi:3-hydroxyacyl-[acyl-carrier-protein] dehydratase|uniref:3-hydroxyacyl-[acyl-carrier-protein] dehydratase FabZ n=1 Tax=Sneathiella sedimenti TaxID=2816034 RepID=A0ABS3F906_9PROT|nr:3-hydroxyacyl-ACP dehydratase FabZ [Sneathiella sedimenti]MBO0334998.1 3-hydroxyacyl-ACP dehydratase FabZ [Sneathiella sedimenti]
MTEKSSADTADTLDILKIMDMIPHRYPLLLVDRLVDIVPGTSATGIKNVTMNEPQFQGHFPNRPIMPGVMIVESMAQTAGVLVIKTLGAESQGKHVLFMSIDNARFRKPVTPGDTMHVHVHVKQNRGAVWRFTGEVQVDGKKVAEADFSAMIVD